MSQPTESSIRKLWSAVMEGRVEEVEALLQEGVVAADASNNSGLQPIHLAAKTGNLEMASLLLSHGACANAKSAKGNTALHTASLIGHVEITKLLLSNGAEVNVTCDCNKDTFTPLYMAAQGGHQEIVTLLLIHGANPLFKTKNGFTPFDIANQQGHVVVAELLGEYSKQKREQQESTPQQRQHACQQKCWQASCVEGCQNHTKQDASGADASQEQRHSSRYQLPRLLHLLPQQRNKIRCSRSCDKMLTRSEAARLQLHNRASCNEAKTAVNKALDRVKAPSVSKEDFMRTPHNSPSRQAE